MNKSNKNITFQNNKLTVMGREIHEGDTAPDFKLTGVDMKDVTNKDFAGKVLVICAIPSIDTPVCATETRKFNEEATKLSKDVVVLTVSEDLPFAQKRWCAAEGVDRVVMASDYKYRGFGENYGAHIQELGLLARSVFVVDRSGKVRHVEYCSAISDEPDYKAALASANAAL